MGEVEEDKSSISKESSIRSVSHADPPRQPQKPQSNESSSSQQGPRRTRPGRTQRQKRRGAAENSAPTTGPSNLNPSAPDFVPRLVVPTPVAQADKSTANANRNRPRGGRRGRPGKEKENVTSSTAAEEPSHGPPVGQPQRTRKHDKCQISSSN